MPRETKLMGWSDPLLFDRAQAVSPGKPLPIEVVKDADPLWHYSLSDYAEAADVHYIGCLRTDGAWYIMRYDDNVGQARYARGASGYNFAGRAALAYDTFENVF